ncbi:unnamed protein product [Somion occarium]
MPPPAVPAHALQTQTDRPQLDTSVTAPSRKSSLHRVTGDPSPITPPHITMPQEAQNPRKRKVTSNTPPPFQVHTWHSNPMRDGLPGNIARGHSSMQQDGPTLVVNPIVRSIHVVQPNMNRNAHPTVIPIRNGQPFPWPPHRSFHELVGLPHVNERGEYIYPEFTRLHHQQRRRQHEEQRQLQERPLNHRPLIVPSQLHVSESSSPAALHHPHPPPPTHDFPLASVPLEPASSSSLPSRLAAAGLHQCEAPGCVTLIPNSNPAPFCRRCSTLSVYDPIEPPSLLPLSLNGEGEASRPDGSRDRDANTSSSFPSLSPQSDSRTPGRDNASLSSPTPSSPTQTPSSPPSLGLNWESDLSDLTPLEESSNNGSEDDSDDEEPRPRLVLRLPPRRFFPPFAPHDSDSPLPEKFKLDPKKDFICGVANCCNLLRPLSRSHLKMCMRHRIALSRYRRRQSERASQQVNNQEEHERHCKFQDCPNLLPPKENHPWRACKDCRYRYRRSRASAKSPLCEFLADTQSSDFMRNVYAQEPSDAFPSYQDFATLLHAFEFHLMGFILGQMQYLQVKVSKVKSDVPDVSSQKLEMGSLSENGTLVDKLVDPMAFSFDGEFSMVADPAGGDVLKRIQAFRKAVEGILGAEMSCGGHFAAPEGLIIGRFLCVHKTIVPLDASSSLNSSWQKLKCEPMSPDIPLASLPRLNRPKSSVVEISMTELKSSSDQGATTTSVTEPPADKAPSPDTHDDHSLTSETSSDTLVGSDASDESTGRADLVVKRMVGELRIYVSWDRRHRYLPGLRTVVRFRLVG